MPDSQRVVPPRPVSAYCVCCALGTTRHEVGGALEEGSTGLRPTVDLPFDTHVGAVPLDPPALERHLSALDTRLTRIAYLALKPMLDALREACRRWGALRVGIALGGCTAGLDVTEKAFGTYQRTGALPAAYSLTHQHDLSAVLTLIREETGIRGPSQLVSTACSSSGKAFASARRLLDAGHVDAVLIGGVDALCQLTLRGFHSLGVLAAGPCQPFAERSGGINIGEGAAFFLVERQGEGRLRLLGIGESNDAHHMTAPHPEGRGAIAAMQSALSASGLTPDAIDYVNAHGTGTHLNDQVELAAIDHVFARDVPVTSTKGYTGHTLGAAGAIEAALALITLEEQLLPRSLGAHPRSQGGLARPVTTARPMACNHVLSNSFAFGGSNVSLVLGLADA